MPSISMGNLGTLGAYRAAVRDACGSRYLADVWGQTLPHIQKSVVSDNGIIDTCVDR